MEDSSSYEKVKHEKQRRNIMYMLFGQYVYICSRLFRNLRNLQIVQRFLGIHRKSANL